MDEFDYKKKCALVVSTCDDYETSWYPYFELIKKYWENHPLNIYLNTETKKYTDEQLNVINVICENKNCTWSERLYNCLLQVEEEYIFFSLEDFFLLGSVKDDAIERCLKWMEEDMEIAVCRLMPSNLDKLIKTEKYNEFRVAGDDIPFRLDTQFALWRKKDLLSFIDLRENPWQFESEGTKRIIGTKKIFLWCYSSVAEDNSISAYPYHIDQHNGYGIAWGKWLWNDKKWFKLNKIKGVKYRKLGVLPKWAANLRFKYLYYNDKIYTSTFRKFIRWIYRRIIKIEKAFAQIRIKGIRKGLKSIKDKRTGAKK